MLPQKEEMKEKRKEEWVRKSGDSNASDSSTSSAHSDVYFISSESEQNQGLLALPVVSIRPEKSKTARENRLIVKFGQRPAGLTTVRNAKGEQIDGRHVSAYVLFREVMIARLDGEDLEDVKQLLRELVSEYIDSQDVLNKFEDYLRLINEAHGQTVFEKQERKNIYKAEIQTQAFFAEALPAEFQRADLSEDAKKFLAELKATRESWAKVNTTPIERRNQFKQGNIFFYQTPLIEMMKGVLTVFNKMEKAAFSAPQPEGSSQTTHISDRIRNGYLKEDGRTVNTDDLKKDLLNSFDYPCAQICSIDKKDGKSLEVIKNEFFQVIRRHIKLFFDALPAITIITETIWNGVIEDFLSRILLEGGWKDLIVGSSSRKDVLRQKDIQQVTQTIKSGLQLKLVSVDEKAEDNKELQLIKIELKQKFSAELSRSLKQAVIQLEAEQHTLNVEDADEDYMLSSSSKQKSKLKLKD